jgi:CHAT domain-containing protein/tetratricopeptide (TPR) repeat protein
MFRGNFRVLQGKTSEAETEYDEAIQILEQSGWNDHLLRLNALLGKGAVYLTIGSFAKAETTYSELTSLYRAQSSIDYSGLLASMINLASTLQALGKYSSADSVLEDASELQSNHLGLNVENSAQVMIARGNLRRLQGRIDQAIAFFTAATSIYRSDTITFKLQYTNSLSDLANAYFDIEEFNKAESLYLEALRYSQRADKEVSPGLAIVYYNLANTNFSQGDLKLAEEYLLLSESAFVELYGPDCVYLCDVWTVLGSIYTATENHVRAEDLINKSVSLRTRYYGEHSLDITYDLNNLANIYFKTNRYRQADSLFRICLTIRDSILGASHPQACIILEGMASVAQRSKKLDSAAIFIKRAIEINRLNGIESGVYLGTLASIYSSSGLASEADSLFPIAETQLIQTYGKLNTHLADLQERITSHFFATNRTEDAMLSCAKEYDLKRQLFLRNVTFLTESEALKYSLSQKRSADRCIKVFLALPQEKRTAVSKNLVDVLVAAKRCVYDQMYYRNKLASIVKDSEAIALVHNYKVATYALKHLYSDPSIDPSSRAIVADSLLTVIEASQSTLGKLTSSRMSDIQIEHVSADSVYSMIPDSSLLIEYFEYNGSIETDSTEFRFAACYADESGFIELVDLGSATFVDSIVLRYRKTFDVLASRSRLPNKEDDIAYRKIAHKLTSILLNTQSLDLSDYSTLYIAPEASLNLVSFSGLLYDQETFLIEKVNIRNIGTSRDFLRREDAYESGHGILLLGDPAFGSSQDNSTGKSLSGEFAPQAYEAGNNFNCKPLPSTRNEILHIQSLWSGLNDDSAIVLLGTAATKTELLKFISNRKIIHLSTHGLFEAKSTESMPVRHRMTEALENPLFGSRLCLAGFNSLQSSQDANQVDQGSLSALDVMGIDLSTTSLVVLSACESGLGKIESGEGMNGLTRSFKLAGAKTVVSTLWRIPDKFSSSIVSSLYAASEYTSVDLKLREAQLKHIHKMRAAGLSDHPFTWAAFVVN